ncbi:hypothetical protein AAF712_013071 [Marasmius tenuissimus]|uniref:Chromo domain-containing protein n=1 Tax=Marasmius tenuissimus TaxID=585030 RepID=A0ABR2ZFQ4_9AGAR
MSISQAYPIGALPIEDHRTVALTGRHHRLPTVFEIFAHPLIPAETRPHIRKIYLVFKDLGDEGLRKHAEFMQEYGRKVPSGPNVRMGEFGILVLDSGDVLFMRKLGSTNPLEDVVRLTLLSQVEIDRWRVDLTRIRDALLGPSSLRRSGKPTKADDGSMVGGIAFERNDYINGLSKSRCYPLGIMRQRAKNVAGPAADNRVNRGDEAGRELRGELLKVCTAIGLYALKSRCPNLLETINNFTDTMNLPRLGDPENGAYPGAQANVAGAITHDSDETLAAEMAVRFGDSHQDPEDASGGVSGACSMSDIPEGYEAGRFHLLEDGVCFMLDGFKFANFSGLQQHGGTPPRAPPGQPVDPSATRLNIILYPPFQVVNGTSRIHVAPLPNGQPFILPPELIHPRWLTESYEPPECTQSTFLGDGGNVATGEAMANYSSRVALQVLHYFLQLLPPELEPHFDPSAILRQIRITVDGEERSMMDWPGGPTGRPFDLGGEDERARRVRAWYEQCRHMGQFMSAPADSELVQHNGKIPEDSKSASKKRKASLQSSSSKNSKKLRNDDKPVDVSNSIARSKPAQELAKPPQTRSVTQSRKAKEGSKPNLSLKAGNTLPTRAYNTRQIARQSAAKTMIASGSRDDVTPEAGGSGPSIDIVGEVHRPGITSVMDEGSEGDDGCSSQEEQESDEEDEYDVKNIRGHEPAVYPTHFQIQWEGYDDEDSWTWEPIENLENCLDKVLQYYTQHQDVRMLRKTRDMLKKADKPFETAGADRWKDSGIPFLNKMHPDCIVELCSLFDQMTAAIQSGQMSATGKAIAFASDANQSIWDRPFDSNTAIGLLQLPNHLRSLKTAAKKASIEAYLLRSFILDSYRNIHQWISGLFKSVSLDVDCTSWVAQLYRDVQRILNNELNPNETLVEISSDGYLPFSPPTVFTFHRGKADRRRRTSLEGDKLAVPAQECTANVILSWLGFEDEPHLWTKMSFLSLLYDTFNQQPAIFLLTPVYEVCDGHIAFLQSENRQGRGKKWTSGDFERFQTALGNLSTEILDDYTCHLQALSESRATYERAIKRQTSRLPLKAAPHTAHPKLSPPNHSDQLASLLEPDEDPLDLLVRFIRSCLIVVESDGEGLTRSQKRVKQDMDGLCPFRDLGTSRSWLLQPGGPCDEDFVSTREGIFSLLYMRGISFHTPSVTHHCGRFNLQTWGEFRLRYANKDESWFCSNAAYGATKGRSVDNVTELWEFSETFHEFLTSNDKPTFKEVVTKLHGLKSWGILTAYLCAVDLVYAGLVDGGREDVAWFITSGKKGAWNGLKKLGYGGTSEQMRQAFYQAYEYVSDALSQKEKEIIGRWDVFNMEHTLCKFSKLFLYLARWGL